LRKRDVVTPLQAVAGALGLIRADGAANSGAGDPAECRGMAIARRRAEREASAVPTRARADRAIIGPLGQAGDLAAGIFAALILIFWNTSKACREQERR